MKTASIKNTVITVLLLLVIAAVVFPIFAKAKIYSGPGCSGVVRSLGRGFTMYAQDNDDVLPSADSWMDKIKTYSISERHLHDPRDVEKGVYGYSYRDSAAGKMATTLGDSKKFALVFDSTQLQRNAHSELNTLPHPGRHGGRDTVGYLDGHAKMLPMP